LFFAKSNKKRENKQLESRDVIIKQKFEVLFREYFAGLCYFARKYVNDIDSSKEIVHNVFIKIWENRLDFDWEKPAKSYLFTSVYNRSMNYIRDNKKFINDIEADLQNTVVHEGTFSENMEAAELESRINQALLNLPEKCRQVFELSRYEGKKYSEIAERLNISVKTVETQISKALKILKEQLKDYLTIMIIMLIKNLQNW